MHDFTIDASGIQWGYDIISYKETPDGVLCLVDEYLKGMKPYRVCALFRYEEGFGGRDVVNYEKGSFYPVGYYDYIDRWKSDGDPEATRNIFQCQWVVDPKDVIG